MKTEENLHRSLKMNTEENLHRSHKMKTEENLHRSHKMNTEENLHRSHKIKTEENLHRSHKMKTEENLHRSHKMNTEENLHRSHKMKTEENLHRSHKMKTEENLHRSRKMKTEENLHRNHKIKTEENLHRSHKMKTGETSHFIKVKAFKPPRILKQKTRPLLAWSRLCLTIYALVFIRPVHTRLQNVIRLALRLDPMRPILGEKFYVYGTVLVNKEIDQEATFSSNVVFGGFPQPCTISNWKFCNNDENVDIETENSCRCDSAWGGHEKGDEKFYLYRFIWYIGITQEAWHLKSVTLRMETGEGQTSGAVNVIKFTQRPKLHDGEFRFCSDQKKDEGGVADHQSRNVVVRWGLGLENASLKSQFTFSSIKWLFNEKEGRRHVLLATVRFGSTENPITVEEEFKKKVHVSKDPTTKFYMLKLLDRYSEDIKSELMIEVKFKQKQYDEEHIKSMQEQPWVYVNASVEMGTTNDPGTTGGVGQGNIRISTSQMGQHETIPPTTTMFTDWVGSMFYNSSETDSPNYPGPIGGAERSSTKSSTSQMTQPRTTLPTTTIVPDKEYSPLKNEKTNLGPLRDNITVYSLISPNPRLKVQITISNVPTDDSYVVLCTSTSLDNFLGKPPVNLTLWQQQPGIKPSRVKTVADTNNMRFSHLYGSNTKYICQMEGDAMDCLTESGATAKKPSEGNISDADSADSETLDWFLLIYAMELFLVISIIMWTVANFIHHVRLIMWAQKMILMEQLDAEFDDKDSD